MSPFITDFFNQVLTTDKQVEKKRVYLSTILHSFSKNPFLFTISYINLANWEVPYSDGLFQMSNYHININRRRLDNNQHYYELIIADNSDGEKRMAVLTAESVESELIEMDCSGMREDVIIDLNEEGRRWGGGELNGKPFGFGREYSENDNLVYEGFVFEGMKVCFGKEWNDDGNNNCLVYEGGYCNGEKWGEGKSYDLNGNVDYDGEWMNNHGMTENAKNDLMYDLIIPMFIEEFVIGNEMFNDKNITTLHFSPLLTRLKRIEIKYRCFQKVREFVIDGLPSLESVKIGVYCFSPDEDEENDDNRSFCVKKCPNLRQLEIGNDCFKYADLLLKSI